MQSPRHRTALALAAAGLFTLPLAHAEPAGTTVESTATTGTTMSPEGSAPANAPAPAEAATETATETATEANAEAAVVAAPDTEVAAATADSEPLTTEVVPQASAEATRAAEEAVRARRRAGEENLAVRQRQVRAIEDDFSGFDPRLINALVALGDALHELKRDNEALEVLERAQHVSRVVGGLHNLEQIKVIDALARVLGSLERWPDAIRAKEYALSLVRRAHGADSIELVGQLYDMANWYESVGHVLGARQAYEHAAVIIDAKVGASDPRRAEALRKLARSYRLERFPEHRPSPEEQRYEVDFANLPNGSAERRVGTLNRFGPGEAALKEAIRIYQRQTPVATVETSATLVELGDWYLLFNKLDLAMLAYREARGQLAQLPEQQRALFAEATPVYFRPPALPRRPPLDAIPEYRGYVDMAFDVSERGEVSNVQVIGATPQDMLTKQALDAMRRARYRPRLDDAGNPVPSSGQRFRFEFPYFQQAGS
jgi:TonB family protein